MRQADRLVFRGMLFYSGLTLFILLGIVFISQLIAKAGGPANSHWSGGTLFTYVFLQMPETAYVVTPLALLIGALAWLSILNSHSEITALRMSGWSLWRLERPLFFVGILGTCWMFALSEWMIPLSSPAAEALWANAGTSSPGFRELGGGQGLWLRQNHQLIQILSVGDQGKHLRNLRIIRAEEGMAGIFSITVAKSADYQEGRWWLDGVTRYRFGTQSLTQSSRSTEPWSISLLPDTLRSFSSHTRVMTLQTLWNSYQNLHGGILAMNRFALAFWQRITYPWVGIVMIWLVVPLVVRNPRGGGLFGWVLLGLALGLIFHFLTQMSGFISISGGIPPAAATLFPLGLFAFFAWMLQRYHH